MVLREHDLVLRVVGIPTGEEFLRGLADVLTVGDRTGEKARDV